jgi:DNA-binding LacI/PurR family transcriptional regulator
MMALGAMRAIKRAGLRVPQDISVIGFDDTPLASLVFPPLTTVLQPVKAMADLAVELLVKRINLRADRKRRVDLQSEYQRVILAPELVVRGTCAQAPD